MNFFKINLNKLSEKGKSNKIEIEDKEEFDVGLRNHEIKYGYNIDILNWSKVQAKIS